MLYGAYGQTDGTRRNEPATTECHGTSSTSDRAILALSLVRDTAENWPAFGILLYTFTIGTSMNRRRAGHRGPRPSSAAQVSGINYANLHAHFGYALKRAQIVAFAAFARATEGLAITPPRYTALVILEANPGISQSALGAVLGTARSGAMALTDWLAEQGLAERRHRPDDGRAWGLYLTERGRALTARLRRRVFEHDQRVAAHLTSAERRTLLRLLEKLSG